VSRRDHPDGAGSATAAGWDALLADIREFTDLDHTVSLLEWDKEVCMSLRGGDARARQIATMRVIRHERLTDPRVDELIDEVSAEPLDRPKREMLRLLRRDRDRAKRLPAEFVRRQGLAEARGAIAWRIAREEGDFSHYQPALEEVIAVKREEAALVGLDGEAYDSLLDVYEPGMRVSRLEPLLQALRDELVTLLGEIEAAGQIEPQPFEGRIFADGRQWDMTMRLLADVGFDLTAGRQDRSAHPFTQSVALDDVRVTTRIEERLPMHAIYSTLHEAGHGMYEQGFDPA
jgi:carboxypeptidase Taq